MSSKVEIPVNKVKLIRLLIGAVILVVLGVLFIYKPQAFVSPIMRSPGVIAIAGIAGVCFFGFCLVFIARKVFDKTPGLIIDREGITNNSNAINAGLIDWDEITRIETRLVGSARFLIIHTKAPEKYIGRTKNVILKWFMKMNYRTYGSPLSIHPTSLRIDFDNLERLISTELERRAGKI